MNDESLKRRLRGLAVPPVDEGAREKALQRSQIALANSHSLPVARPFPGWRWGLAPGLALLLGLLWFARPHAGPEPQPSAKVLAEMEALFPGQVDAVILQGNSVKLDLSDTPEGSSQQPLVVTLRRGGQTVQVLAYSGRKVCVELGGRRECFEPLVTAEGKVILSGDDFVWEDNNPRPVAGYSVQARSLSL